MAETAKRIFGIDLGTTYSSIAYVDEFGKAVMIPNAENERVTPSVVFFDEDAVIVGEVAKESAKLYPGDVVSFIKRSMGEPNFLFLHNGESIRAEEISAYILRKLVKDAEHFLSEKVTDVVITCPAYFGINEREATRKAGEIAGLTVRQIINEPTAAAIAYDEFAKSDNGVVLVYDLGGGTFDITMIDIRKDSVEVICTGGDHHLGGKDWDDRISSYLVDVFQNETGTNEDILEDPDTLQDIILSVERAKKNLSQRQNTPISITHAGERIKTLLGREKFEELTADLLDRTIDFTHRMLEEAKEKGYPSFDEFILVGGATRMPMVQERIQKEFSIVPKVFDPDEAVAKGAAIFGWKLMLSNEFSGRLAEKINKPINQLSNISDLIKNKEICLQDVKDAKQQVSEATGCSFLKIETALMRVKNVTSKSFGIVAYNDNDQIIVFNLVLKNTGIPVVKKQKFYTTSDNQHSILIRIMESDTSQVEIPLGLAVDIRTATLSLPPLIPADSAIEVTFVLNEEGRLQISAVETGEGHKIDILVDTASVIQDEDFEKAKSRSQCLVVH
ncbi:MAG: Hsp70 family protein [Desulfobacteraceae bacterium]|nr:MAG: Hsp70 family protein [Desulfobacteraceae bacterium]